MHLLFVQFALGLGTSDFCPVLEDLNVGDLIGAVESLICLEMAETTSGAGLTKWIRQIERLLK